MIDEYGVKIGIYTDGSCAGWADGTGDGGAAVVITNTIVMAAKPFV